jgi:Protein of unknown function (DUF2442)
VSALGFVEMRSTPQLLEARALEGHRVHVRFEDGTTAEVDLSDLLEQGGVFEPLFEREFFARLKANREAGTIVWPNGADIAPESLYERARRTSTEA